MAWREERGWEGPGGRSGAGAGEGAAAGELEEMAADLVAVYARACWSVLTEPGDGIAVVLTRSDGGTAAITRTDPDGRYSIPLVGVGQYVLTAVDRATNDITTASVASDGEKK